MMLAVMACMTVRAYDFEVDGIYYSFDPNVDNGVSVVCGDTSQADRSQNMPAGPSKDIIAYDFMWWKGNSYKGDVVVPAEVWYTKEGVTRRYYVKSVGVGAFCHCRELKSVVLPYSVETLSAGAFYNCSTLESVDMPDYIRFVDNYAFAGCRKLSELHYPSELTYIADTALSYVGADVENFTLTGTENVTYIYPYGCMGIGIKDLSPFRKLAATYPPTFSYSKIEIVDFTPFAAIDLAQTTDFSYCEKLHTVIIPAHISADNISSRYTDCPNISLIRLGAPTPPQLMEDWAAGVSAECVLEVPEEAVEAYREAPYWKNFKNIRGMQASVGSVDGAAFSAKGAQGAVLVEGAARVSLYDTAGRCLYDGDAGRIPAAPGLYIVKCGSTSAKVLVK